MEMAERVGFYLTRSMVSSTTSQASLLLLVKWFIYLHLQHTNIMCLCDLVLERRFAIRFF
jgi:hypothetical protein